MAGRQIVEFSHIGRGDGRIVGGKGVSLGELTQAGFPVPPGFIVTAAAFDTFVKQAKLGSKIDRRLNSLTPEDPTAIQKAAHELQHLLLKTPFPHDLALEVTESYQRLRQTLGTKLAVAVRSSLIIHHAPATTIASHEATFLNVIGASAVIRAIHHVWASLFEPQALYYRLAHGSELTDFGIAIPVQTMIQSVKAGVLFTVNPNSGNTDEIILEAIRGLGLPLVMGAVTPNRYIVSKADQKVLERTVVAQAWQLVRSGRSQAHGTRHESIPKAEQRKPVLSDQEILALGLLGEKVEAHYQQPQNIEWTIDERGTIWLVDATALEVQPAPASAPAVPTAQSVQSKVLVKGLPASFGFAVGPVRIIHSPRQLSQVKAGEIVVTEQTDPSFVPALQKAVGVVTDAGGMTSHAVLMSRELSLPCVVGTGQATHVLKNGLVVTVDGQAGLVYKGKVSQSKTMLPTTVAPITATKVYVNLAEPHRAEAAAALPVDGVGLLRAEFMLAKFGIHPRFALAEKKDHLLVRKLTDGLHTIAVAFTGRPVIYRASDFKTNEYRHLEGGEKAEPREENPMLGYRGALRYVREPDLFQMELQAVKAVRESYGCRNVSLMIPFVRTLEEWQAVRGLVEASGLLAEPDFKLQMMIEVPSAVILLEQFLAAGVDGVSIGSNDLTQLILGVDRDNAKLATAFDERQPAVLAAMRHVVEVCRRQHVSVSICGQAATLYPEVLEELVAAGITSVSVQPDSAVAIRRLIASIERRILLDALTETAHGKPHPLWHRID